MKIKPKIGVVSCSGECCSFGTVSRIATRIVLEELKANETVTICLPLFLAGDEGERRFAVEFPTIAVEGCDKLCATKAIEKYSGKTAGTVEVERMYEEWEVKPPISRRVLTAGDLETTRRIAVEIAEIVEDIRGS